MIAMTAKPIRVCRLPVLPQGGPLGGHVLSHDQIEAALMRRAGYEVRVIPAEGISWEENPPTLMEFIRRELRWCQGNMQYFWLLGLPGLKPVSRFQLVLAILMYLGSPAWMALLAVGSLAVGLRDTSYKPTTEVRPQCAAKGLRRRIAHYDPNRARNRPATTLPPMCGSACPGACRTGIAVRRRLRTAARRRVSAECQAWDLPA
jgi:hypothetical protein